MDTVSLLVSRLARLDVRVVLVPLVCLGVGLLAAAGLDLGLVAAPEEPLLGPFRWVPLGHGLA